jgi:hypothetical protein
VLETLCGGSFAYKKSFGYGSFDRTAVKNDHGLNPLKIITPRHYLNTVGNWQLINDGNIALDLGEKSRRVHL